MYDINLLTPFCILGEVTKPGMKTTVNQLLKGKERKKKSS